MHLVGFYHFSCATLLMSKLRKLLSEVPAQAIPTVLPNYVVNRQRDSKGDGNCWATFSMSGLMLLMLTNQAFP